MHFLSSAVSALLLGTALALPVTSPAGALTFEDGVANSIKSDSLHRRQLDDIKGALSAIQKETEEVGTLVQAAGTDVAGTIDGLGDNLGSVADRLEQKRAAQLDDIGKEAVAAIQEDTEEVGKLVQEAGVDLPKTLNGVGLELGSIVDRLREAGVPLSSSARA